LAPPMLCWSLIFCTACIAYLTLRRKTIFVALPLRLVAPTFLLRLLEHFGCVILQRIGLAMAIVEGEKTIVAIVVADLQAVLVDNLASVEVKGK